MWKIFYFNDHSSKEIWAFQIRTKIKCKWSLLSGQFVTIKSDINSYVDENRNFPCLVKVYHKDNNQIAGNAMWYIKQGNVWATGTLVKEHRNELKPKFYVEEEHTEAEKWHFCIVDEAVLNRWWQSIKDDLFPSNFQVTNCEIIKNSLVQL